MMILIDTYDSPVGVLTLAASEDGLRAVLWPDERAGRVRLGDTAVGRNAVMDRAAEQLDEYFAGTRRSFDLALDPVGTEFQRSVWRSLTEIGFGETSSYAKQAAALGRPTAVRAVASANGRNPLSIVVPCHRVVGADGSLTGFAGGLGAKAFLLDHERAVVDGRTPSHR